MCSLPPGPGLKAWRCTDFNTSNVFVAPDSLLSGATALYDFNTSNVFVALWPANQGLILGSISIHLMCSLPLATLIYREYYGYISIHLMCSLPVVLFSRELLLLDEFQYI